MKIGFTGTRRGMTTSQIHALRELIGWANPGDEFHHSDCIGADAIAAGTAACRGYVMHVHPPTARSLRAHCYQTGMVTHTPKPYLERNRDIVDSVDWLIAASKTSTEERRSGTWSTVRYARSRGVKITVVWPDGAVTDC